MKKQAVITLLFLLSLTCGFPQSESKIDRGVDNLAAEYAEFTAYLELVTSSIKGEEEEDTRAQYAKVKDDCMFYSLLLASEGRKKEIAIQVTNARIEIAKKQMLKEIDYDNANLSILISKYQEDLLRVIQNPPQILLEVIAKKTNEVDAKKG